MRHRVTVVPGDGVGPEVVRAAQEVIEATGVRIDWEPHQLRGRDPASLAGLVEAIRSTGIALKGPLATGTSGERSPNVALRRALDLFVQLRPSFRPAGSGRPPMDVVVVRETTEDLYRGIEIPADRPESGELVRWLEERGFDEGLPAGTGFSIKPASAGAVRRAGRFTLEWMRRAGRSRLTVVHKATVMRATDGIYLDVVDELARDVPEIEVDRCQIDAACAQLITHPERFDVLFMSNMYGDIVSDVAAALSGGLGLAPGVNHGDALAVFEPVHGTAPRHAGRGDINPLAMVRCGAMLLDHLGEREAASRVRRAVEGLLAERQTVTYDVLGTEQGAASTREVAAALADELRTGRSRPGRVTP